MLREFFPKVLTLQMLRHCSDDQKLRIVLALGIVTRIIVFIFQHPFNNDNHFRYIYDIFTKHSIPISIEHGQAYHPPLYYVLASLFLYLGDAKIVQVFSLVLSIATLFIYYFLIKNLYFIRPFTTKKYCLMLVGLLPQFIMFGNYVSNDTLTFFIGSLISLQVFNYINNPCFRSQNILALYLGLGLLTKATFLAFIPVLLFLIIIIKIRQRISPSKIIAYLLIFGLMFSLIGSYKFVQNQIYLSKPFYNNLDSNEPWLKKQKPTYIGLKSIYDINLVKLVSYPTITPHTSHSYPLLLYGTFWYQYIPESNFKGNRSPLKYLGSFIYIVAVVPTLIFFVGFLRVIYSGHKLLSYRRLSKIYFNKLLYEIILVGLLMMNILMVVSVGVKYDVTSVFQSRSFFPSFGGIIIIFSSGLNLLKRYKKIKPLIFGSLNCLFILFLVYFITEIGYLIFSKTFWGSS